MTNAQPELLLSLEQPRIAELSSTVARSGSIALVVVHPWFSEVDPALRADRVSAQKASLTYRQLVSAIRSLEPIYLADLERTLRGNTPAIGILFEEHERSAATWTRLRSITHTRNWLLVPTVERSPTPQLGNVRSLTAPHEDQISAWHQVGKKLRGLGVQTLLVCGAYCSLHPAARQCVDGTAYALEQFCGFKDVQILNGPTLRIGEGASSLFTFCDAAHLC